MNVMRRDHSRIVQSFTKDYYLLFETIEIEYK